MPAPPLESEPAIVTAIGVVICRLLRFPAWPAMTVRPDRRHLRGMRPERSVHNGAQLAGGCLRVRLMGQCRNHRDAVDAGGDDRLGVRGGDAGDAAAGEVADAAAQDLDDATQTIE